MRIPLVVHHRYRLLIALLAGVLLGSALPAQHFQVSRAVLAWDGMAIVYVGLALATLGGNGAHASFKKAASREDPSLWIILVMMSAASFVSVIAIGTLLTHVKDLPAPVANAHLGIGAATVLASWSFIHTLFAVHYAHEFYGDDDPTPVYSARGGLDFPQTAEPIFSDFLYYSFVVGMTCQVADVDITSASMRRLTVGHGILCFFFNTVILALSVNVAASLLS